MFVACGIWCLAHRQQTYHINLVDQTHFQHTYPHRKTVFFKTSLQVLIPGQTGFTYIAHDHELFAILGDVPSKQHKIKMTNDVDAVEDLLFKIMCGIKSTLQ